jgi:hypothetical protein
MNDFDDGSDNSIFGEGWRDPTDDGRRMFAYILLGAALLGSPFLAGFGLYAVVKALQSARFVPNGVFGIVAIVVGLGLLAGLVSFFVEESKHWDLKHITADRVVAGLFLFGIVLVAIGLRVGAGAGQDGVFSIWPFAVSLAGVAVLAVTFLVGLVLAFWPALVIRTRELGGTLVLDRYVLDDKAMVCRVEDIVDGDPWTPIVKLKTANGRELTLVAYQSAYRVAEPGMFGKAQVKGERLIRFSCSGRRFAAH